MSGTDLQQPAHIDDYVEIGTCRLMADGSGEAFQWIGGTVVHVTLQRDALVKLTNGEYVKIDLFGWTKENRKYARWVCYKIAHASAPK